MIDPKHFCTDPTIHNYFKDIMDIMNIYVDQWSNKNLDMKGFIDKMQIIIDSMKTCL